MSCDIGEWAWYIYYGGMSRNSDEATSGRGRVVSAGAQWVWLTDGNMLRCVRPCDVFPDSQKGDADACAEAARRNRERGYPA
jgi:hypothetical protein